MKHAEKIFSNNTGQKRSPKERVYVMTTKNTKKPFRALEQRDDVVIVLDSKRKGCCGELDVGEDCLVFCPPFVATDLSDCRIEFTSEQYQEMVDCYFPYTDLEGIVLLYCGQKYIDMTDVYPSSEHEGNRVFYIREHALFLLKEKIDRLETESFELSKEIKRLKAANQPRDSKGRFCKKAN